MYSDKDHTRFTFYDKAAAMDAATHIQGANEGMSAANAQVDPGSIRPGAVGPGGSPAGGIPSYGPSTTEHRNISAAYLRKGKLKPGPGIAGWITLRQPKGGKLEVRPTDMLDEVDIPVNGIVFRF